MIKKAKRQCRQAIRKLRKQNPDARVVVTGCTARINPQMFASMEQVDLLLGYKRIFENMDNKNALRL